MCYSNNNEMIRKCFCKIARKKYRYLSLFYTVSKKCPEYKLKCLGLEILKNKLLMNRSMVSPECITRLTKRKVLGVLKRGKVQTQKSFPKFQPNCRRREAIKMFSINI
jgi:hypothetical protein